MTTDPKEIKAARRELLKRLRVERADQVEHAKEQVKITKRSGKIREVLTAGPKTVPDISSETEMSTDDVLYYIATMRHYGNVVEDSQDGDYFRYKLVVEEKTEEA